MKVQAELQAQLSSTHGRVVALQAAVSSAADKADTAATAALEVQATVEDTNRKVTEAAERPATPLIILGGSHEPGCEPKESPHG